MQGATATLPTAPDPCTHAGQPPSHRRKETRHHSQEPQAHPVRRGGQRPPGSAPRLRLAGAWRAAPQGGRTRRAARPSPGSPGPGPARPSRSRRRKLQPAGRKLWPQPDPRLAPALSHATKGLVGVDEGPPRPRRGPRRPERAEDPLPPAERRPVVAGRSLTRAIVAVAILRPSRPPRAPHARAPSAVSRDVGACGGARRKTELSR